MKLLIQGARIAGTATDDYTGPDQFIPAPEDFDPARMADYIYEGGALVLPDPPAPTTCTGAQGQLALLELGKYQTARAYIDGIQDPEQKLRAEIEWSRPSWERANPFLQAIWEALGGTPEGLDDAFRLAVTL